MDILVDKWYMMLAANTDFCPLVSIKFASINENAPCRKKESWRHIKLCASSETRLGYYDKDTFCEGGKKKYGI